MPVLAGSANKQAAKEKNAKIYNPQKAEIIYDRKNFIKYENTLYELGLMGKYQEQNGALAICASKVLNINEKILKKGLKNVKWKCRFEYIKDKNIIIDGCHNPDGAKNLKKIWRFRFLPYLCSPVPRERVIDILRK